MYMINAVYNEKQKICKKNTVYMKKHFYHRSNIIANKKKNETKLFFNAHKY